MPMRTASDSSAPAAGQTSLQVLQAAARLIADRALDELAGRGVERDLARAVEHAAAADRVAVGADGVGRAGRGDGDRDGGTCVRTLVSGRLRPLHGPLPCPTMRARSTLAALAAAVTTLVLAPGAHAAIAYAPCEPAGFQCGQLAVPLDRTGAVPGTVTLNVKRVVAASNPTATAVVALAGGPGQAAIPVATEFASILGPSLATRDLLVYDQRGTGSSGRLTCPAFEQRRLVDRRRRRGVRQPARAAARLLPHRGLGRRHRGPARRVRLPEARALRRLLRHQGRPRLRGQVPGQRRVAGAGLGRAARGLRRPQRLDLQDHAARPRRAVRQRRLQRHHDERRPRPVQPRAQGRAQGDHGEGQHAGRAQPHGDPRPGRRARHPARRRPEPDAALRAARRDAQRDPRRQPPAAAPAAARQGPDRDPRCAQAGRPRRGRLRCALRRHALRGVRLPVGSRRGPRAARRPGGGRRQGAPGHGLPALQLQGRAAQRGDPGVRGVAERQPAAGAADPAPRRAHAHPLGRLRPAHAARGRRRRRRADPGRPARRRALHRPLGRHQRPQRLRQERDRRLLRGPAGGAVPERSSRSSRRPPSPRRAWPSCTDARRRSRRSPP